MCPARASPTGGGPFAMLNIGYFKGLPTEHVFKYSGGRLRREGRRDRLTLPSPRSTKSWSEAEPPA